MRPSPGATNGPEDIKTKEQILKYLRDSFALGHKAFATFTAENAVTPLVKSPIQSMNTRLAMASFVNLHLQGKRALVTGSSSGIGAEIARMLALEGVKVVVHGREETRAKAVTKEIESAGGQAVVVLGDLNSKAGAASVVETAQQAFEGIDILVNNVGGSANVAHQSWFDAPLEEWAENYQHNVLVTSVSSKLSFPLCESAVGAE